MNNSHKALAWATTIALAVISIIGTGPSTYRFAVVFLAPLVWGLYFARHRLHLHPGHFAVFCSAVLLHTMGAFGAYQKSYAGIEFDIYVHFYFGVAGGLLVARGLAAAFALRGWQLWVGTVLLILGLSVIHELVEYASTLVLGPEKGMLKINSPEKFDTQKDLLNGLGGALLAMAVYSWGFGKFRSASGNSSEASVEENFRGLATPSTSRRNI